MRVQTFTLFLWITAALPTAFASAAELLPVNGDPATRYAGSARLIAPQPTSADGRFTLSAELHSAPMAIVAKNTDRFSLLAQLQPSARAKSLNTTCGPVVDAVFKNGFE